MILAAALLAGCSQFDGVESPEDTALRGQVLLAQLAGELPEATRASRAVLLGNRDPDGNSLVRQPKVGELDEGIPKVPPGDANGGPGLRILQLYYREHRASSPSDDLRWHREVFVPFLKRLRDDSARAHAKCAAVHRLAMQLTDWLAGQRELPPGIRPVAGQASGGWPAHCLTQVDQAVARKDLPAARAWAGELTAAAFALTDLHRWLEFLIDNQLANLRMQDDCEEHFRQRDRDYATVKYDVRMCISRFAGGSLSVTTINNYVEVERQAECLFRKPARYARALASLGEDRRSDPLLVYVPPDLREDFVRLCAKLSSHNRSVLEVAATLPFERSFVANMVFRIGTAGKIDELGEALRRFDRLYPKAEPWQIMDILVYRAGLGMAGIEWGDRFDGRLMKMSAGLDANTPREALLAARKLQYGVYGGSANYRGLVLTLRRALDTSRMDCIRATDMIGALYRNAGWPGFAYIRWCRGTSGHSVAAAEQFDPNGRRITIVDGLFPPGRAVGAWPDEYLTGHADLYAVELFGRGLDTCIFLEGCILRGPNAGKLIRAPVPYLPRRQGAAKGAPN